MADSKITALTSIGTSTDPSLDQMVIVDTSDGSMAATGTTKKVSLNQLLSSNPSATGGLTLSGALAAGSATITGDLTVDTNVLKVDSLNNRVGIVNASPTYPLDVSGSGRFTNNVYVPSSVTYKVGPVAATWAGLRFDSLNAMFLDSDTSISFRVNGGTSFSTAAVLDSSGNLGLGVTPSAWNAIYKTFQFGPTGAAASSVSNDLYLTNNVFWNSANSPRYIVNGKSTVYYQDSGNHSWWTAGTGTAGNAITFTQAMTLDASGNLLVGVTSANANGGVLQLKSGITFPATQVDSSDANTLDDYEEGTFTPTIVGTTTAGTGTYTTQLGRYTKVGRIVTVDIALTWTAHDGTGNMDIGGLPFSVLATTGYSAAAAIGYIENIALTAGNVATAVLWWFNTTKVRLNQTPTGGGAAAGVPMDTAGQINLSLTYIAA